jgi:hypothetical protein
MILHGGKEGAGNYIGQTKRDIEIIGASVYSFLRSKSRGFSVQATRETRMAKGRASLYGYGNTPNAT